MEKANDISKENTLEKEDVKTSKSKTREYIESILIALCLALLVRSFIVQAFKIPSGSMKNTLLVGDHILVNKFIYGIKIPNQLPFFDYKFFPDIKLFTQTPKRGDVIVFEFPKDPTRDFIKRTIGLPGDKLEIINKIVYINDQPIDEPYALHLDLNLPEQFAFHQNNFGPLMIPEGKLFMLGDNRENSQDSRYWGFLDIEKVKGKAFIIYWSWDSEEASLSRDCFSEKGLSCFGSLRWSRLGKILR